MSPTAPRLVTRARRSEAVVLGLAGLTGALGGWEGAARLRLVDPIILASPARVGAALVRQWSGGELIGDLGWSAAEFVLGFGLAAAVGVVVGLAMGAWRGVELALDPFVWFLYATPLVALHPLDRKSTRLNSSHSRASRMPSSA